MSVRLAALIPLFACFLVLPSDVSGQRRTRQTLQEETKEEYEVSHIRKREAKLTEAFGGANLAKSCDVCNQLYKINKANCVASQKKAKYKCFMKAKENKPKFFYTYSFSLGAGEKATEVGETAADTWVPVGDPRRNLKLGSEDEYFKDAHIKRTCTACNACYDGISIDDCVADKGDARKNCRMTMNEMRYRFVTEFDKAPARRPLPPSMFNPDQSINQNRESTQRR